VTAPLAIISNTNKGGMLNSRYGLCRPTCDEFSLSCEDISDFIELLQ
jgi:hypothetical protein